MNKKHKILIFLGLVEIRKNMPPALVPNIGFLLVLPGIPLVFQLVYLVVCLVALVALFKKRNTPKPIKQKKNKGSKIHNQKYIIRKRDQKGRLRHIETVTNPPDEQYLNQFGSGNFCILTSRPKIALWKNIDILEAEVKKVEQSKTENCNHETQIPPPTFNHKRVIEQIPTIQDIKPQKQLQNSRNHIKKMNRTRREKGKIYPPPPCDEIFDISEANIQAYEPKMPIHIEKKVIENKTTNPDNQNSIRSLQKIKKEEIKKTTCSLCKDTSGVHVICAFCGKLFCEGWPKNCHDNHLCEKSVVCHHCGRRIQNELVEISQYCHNAFCSQRCINLCFKDHKEDSDCKDCPGFKETESNEFKENGEEECEEGDENMDELDNECVECGATIEESMDYCPNCGSEIICDEEETEESEPSEGELECPECNATIEESMSFCPDCGMEIVEEEGDESKCEECGTNVNESDKFCPSCGIEFKEEEEDETENDDCDGDCSDCTSDDCEGRCEQHGKCKDCRAYEECEIRCELAEDGCSKWVCKGFDCEDRTVEIEGEKGTQNNGNIAAIYCRVSTKEQTLGHSLDEQKRRCKEYIRNRGIKYHRFYIDDGYSGKTLDRPEMQRLIGDIIDDKVSHIVVWKLDRLSRSLTDSLLFIEDLTNAGIKVVSVTEDIDTSTTIGKIVISVLSGFSQIEIEKMSERVKMGLEARFREKKWHGGPPYGYDYNQKTGKLKINPNESKVVRMIFDKYLDCNSLGEVRKFLIKKKIPTRSGNGWCTNTVGAVLSRTAYVGFIKRGDIKIEYPKLKIIEEQVFNAAQEIRESRVGLSPGFGRREEVYY